jgi:hypothetical protein
VPFVAEAHTQVTSNDMSVWSLAGNGGGNGGGIYGVAERREKVD